MTNKLRVLSLNIKEYPLFEDNVQISLLTQSRVLSDNTDTLMNLFGANYTNNITTIVGKNATGKTTILKLMMGILSLLFNEVSVSQTRLREALFDNSNVGFDVYLYGSDGFLYKDEIVIRKDADNGNFIIEKEMIFMKKASKTETKKKLLDFSKAKLLLDRNKLNSDASSMLASDDSLFRSVIRKNNYDIPKIMDNTIFTNNNLFVSNLGYVSSEILEYLDPSIEYLKIERKNGSNAGQAFYRLKFKNMEDEITDNNFATIEYYLSSGTAKGVSLYTQMLTTLKSGGIIFVDEIENHFNHAIARTFINYFEDPAVNINHAKLVFTTHYAEFLDDMERNDQIYIARRNEKISLTRYSDTNMRNDVMRSEVFEADNLGGTAPKYSAYLKLRKATILAIGGEKEMADV